MFVFTCSVICFALIQTLFNFGLSAGWQDSPHQFMEHECANNGRKWMTQSATAVCVAATATSDPRRMKLKTEKALHNVYHLIQESFKHHFYSYHFFSRSFASALSFGLDVGHYITAIFRPFSHFALASLFFILAFTAPQSIWRANFYQRQGECVIFAFIAVWLLFLFLFYC